MPFNWKMCILLSSICLGCISTLLAQEEDRMGQLLKERDELYKAYDYYSHQNSSFFGKKSKKDLQNIISTLKSIIAKDNQIIQVVRVMGRQRESSFVGQAREKTNRVYDLTYEVDKLNAQIKLKAVELRDKKDAYQALEEQYETLRKVLIGVGVVALLLIFYIIRLRRTIAAK